MTDRPDQRWNCLSPGQTIAEIVRQELAAGVDVRYCRNLRDDDDSETEIATTEILTEAQFGTIYVMTVLGEAIAIHDFQFDSAGIAKASTCFVEIMIEIAKWKSELPSVDPMRFAKIVGATQ